jgi:hypothetical protein
VPRPAPPPEQPLLARAARKRMAAQRHEDLASRFRAEASRMEDEYRAFRAALGEKDREAS